MYRGKASFLQTIDSLIEEFYKPALRSSISLKIGQKINQSNNIFQKKVYEGLKIDFSIRFRIYADEGVIYEK